MEWVSVQKVCPRRFLRGKGLNRESFDTLARSSLPRSPLSEPFHRICPSPSDVVVERVTPRKTTLPSSTSGFGRDGQRDFRRTPTVPRPSLPYLFIMTRANGRTSECIFYIKEVKM